MARINCKLLFFFTLVSLVVLTGCGSDASAQSVEPETEEIIESNDSIDPSTELSADSIEEKKAYLTEKMAMPSYDEYTCSALTDIGFQEITDVFFENVDMEVGGDIDLSIAVTDIDGKIVLMECYYMHVVDDWMVSRITDYDNGNCYWAYGDTDKMVDMYDYQTGELVSERSDYRTIYEILEDAQEESDKIKQDFEDDLDRIADEYNIKR